MKLGDWKFRALHDGRFKLDGGSMFGVVPKVMWEKKHPADESNRIDLDLRCLLAESGEQAIQIHAGIGTSDELRVSHYFKRLLCIETLLGSMDYHLDRYAMLMEDASP